MIIGGSPCQDFSFQGNLNGGERAGLEGERGQLVFEFFRILRLVEKHHERIRFTFKPAFVYENVNGMSGEIKDEIVKWLECAPTQLNADIFPSLQAARFLHELAGREVAGERGGVRVEDPQPTAGGDAAG